MNQSYIHLRIHWENDPSNKVNYHHRCLSEERLSEVQTLIEKKFYIPVQYQELTYKGSKLSNPMIRMGSISMMYNRVHSDVLDLVLKNTCPKSNKMLEFTVALTHNCKYGEIGTQLDVVIEEYATFYDLSQYLQNTWSLNSESILYLSDGKYYDCKSVCPVSTVLGKRHILYLAILDTGS